MMSKSSDRKDYPHSEQLEVLLSLVKEMEHKVDQTSFKKHFKELYYSEQLNLHNCFMQTAMLYGILLDTNDCFTRCAH